MSPGIELGRARVDVLWDVSSLVATGGAMLVGLALIVAAWVGASGLTVIDGQFAWLNLGVFGVVLAGAAGALWIMQGRRAVGRRMHAMLVVPGEARAPIGAGDLQAAATGNGAFVAAAAMTRYHVPSCLLVQGKSPAAKAPESFHRREGRRPCEMCVAGAVEAGQ
jgi:hypothetical protein